MARRNFIKYIFPFLCIACIVQFSCSKSSSPAQRSKFDILTGIKWKVQSLYFRDKGEPVSANVAAGYFTYKTCELDDVYIFRKDSTFSRLDSLVQCDDLDLDLFHINIFGPYSNSMWSVNSDFSQMQITLPVFYNFEWKILTLNETQFRVEENKTDVFGGEHIYTFLFIPAP